MATVSIGAEPIPLRMNEDGVMLVGKTRVPIGTVVRAWWDGATPEQIVDDFDTLELADVYAVIAYYLRHRPEVDRYLAEREQEAVRVRRENEASWDPREFRERLLRRQASLRQSRDASVPH